MKRWADIKDFTTYTFGDRLTQSPITFDEVVTVGFYYWFTRGESNHLVYPIVGLRLLYILTSFNSGVLPSLLF